MRRPIRFPLEVALAAALAAAGAACAAAEDEAPRGLEKFSQQILDFYGRAQDVAYEDLDRDGRIDVAVVHESTVDGQRHRYVSFFFQNPDTGFGGMPDQTLTPPARAGAMTLADIDPAPGMELLWIVDDGVWFHTLESGRYGRTPQRLLFFPTFFEMPQPDALPFWDGAVDIDGNGATDLIVPQRDGFLVFFQGPVGKFSRIQRLDAKGERTVETREGAFLNLTATLPAVHVEDFDGDGRKDILVTARDHFEYFLQDAQGGLPAGPSGQFDLTFFREQLKRDQVQSVVARLMDVNGDRSVDMIVAYTHGDIGVFESIMTQVLVFFGKQGRPYANSPDQIINLSGVSIEPRIVDINRDGLQDLVVSSLRTDLFAGLKGVALKAVSVSYYIYLFNAEEGRFHESPDYDRDVSVPTKALEQGGSEIPRINFDGDFDHDGLLDMVTVSGQGRLAIYPGRKSYGIMHSGGFAFRKDEHLLVTLKDNPRSIDIADLNGDGRSDLSLRHTSRLEVFLSK